MKNITITVDENLISTLERLAGNRSITNEVYISDFVGAHLLSQYKAHIIEKITTKKLPDIVTIDAAVSAIDETIKERDKPVFVPAPEDTK